MMTRLSQHDNLFQNYPKLGSSGGKLMNKDLTAISGQTMASIRHGPKITTSRLISELVWFIQLYIYIYKYAHHIKVYK